MARGDGKEHGNYAESTILILLVNVVTTILVGILSQGMTTPALVEPRLVYSSLDGLLEHRLCQMVPTCHTRTRIAGASRRRKDIWPFPCCRRAWLVPFACIWDIPRTTACEPLGLLPQCSSLQ